MTSLCVDQSLQILLKRRLIIAMQEKFSYLSNLLTMTPVRSFLCCDHIHTFVYLRARVRRRRISNHHCYHSNGQYHRSSPQMH